MSTQCHYEINVAKLKSRVADNSYSRYEHYFATAERSLLTEDKAKALYEELLSLFPAPVFQVTCTYYDCKGIPQHFQTTNMEQGS